MVGLLPKLPGQAWANVIKWTIGFTFITTITSVAASCAVMIHFNGFIDVPGIAAALTLPLVLTPAIVGIFSIRHQQLKLANAELQRLAYRDTMLGCMNRHGFTSALDIALQYASVHRPCALLIIDADNFKQVNDRFGHDQGDLALRVIADAIGSATRVADIIGRIGGEEFGAFLPGTGEAQARAIADRIRAAVTSAHFAPTGEPYPLSVSIGGVIATEPGEFAELYRTADKRLYAAKQSGRNRTDFDIAVPEKASDAA